MTAMPALDTLKRDLRDGLRALTGQVFAALELLEQLRLRVAILAKSVATSHALSDWSEAYPGIVWRTMDEYGRLYGE